MDQDQEETAGVVPAGVMTKLAQGEIESWGKLVAAVAPPSEQPKVSVVPAPRAISETQKAAVELLPEVFASVVPTEPRMLTPEETSWLLKERATLAAIKKMVTERMDDISLTVLNHSDVEYEELAESGEPVEGVMVDADGKPWRNAKGHVVRKTKIIGADPSDEKLFSIEARKGTPSASPTKLKELAADESVDYIEHKDYLAMTRQERVFDENAAMIAIRKKPELLRALVEASEAGLPTVSVYERAKK